MFSKFLNGTNVRKLGSVTTSTSNNKLPIISSLFPHMFCNEKDVDEFIPGAGTPISLQGYKPNLGKDHVFEFMRLRDVERYVDEQSLDESDVKICGELLPESECYQPASNVNLQCVMQTNVPEPYSKGRPSHFNMPGGGVRLDQKYTSSKLNSNHPSRPFSTNVILQTCISHRIG